MIARSGTSGTAYWSAYDPGHGGGLEQTFWNPLSEVENVLSVVGAVPYRSPSGDRHVYLFVRTGGAKGEDKLVLWKYDLEREMWTGMIDDLNSPAGVTSFTAVVLQQSTEAWPPSVVLRAADGAVYRNQLNAEGTG